MAKQESVEEQVAALTQEQRDTIVKVGNKAVILLIAGMMLWLFIAALGFYAMVNPPSWLDYTAYDKLYVGMLTWMAIGAIYVVGIYLFVKIKYPYYSDAKCKYIKKLRKKNAEQ